MNTELRHRFERQLLLKEFDEPALAKLLHAKVLVVGVGALGCPCSLQLAASGVGTIGIADFDRVEVHNLHRQILYTQDDVGLMKTQAASKRLQAIHPHTNIVTHCLKVDENNIVDLICKYDVVVDCTDSMQTRLVINDACVTHGLPFIYGAIYKYEGQIAVLNTDRKHINLRDVFDATTLQTMPPSCYEIGVMAGTTLMVGSIQAWECIKLLTGHESALRNKVLYINTMNYLTQTMDLHKRADDGASINSKPHPTTNYELNKQEFLEKIKGGHVRVIDVRNHNEKPALTEFDYEVLPLSELLINPPSLDDTIPTLLFCHAGIRSLQAWEFLTETCGYKNIYHLKGGILTWNT